MSSAADPRLAPLRDSLIGLVLTGAEKTQYHLRECLGEGGQGWVFRANWNDPDGVYVIVKVLRPDVVSTEALTRFKREAEVLRMLSTRPQPNPYVVRFYDHAIAQIKPPHGGEPVGMAFTVLEYVNGPTLERVLADQGGRGLSIDRTRRLMRHIVQALDLVHSQKIVHRDLKPSNILLATEGGVEIAKVTDFGLVKLVDMNLHRTTTLAGASLGYAPPEQYEQGNQRVSPRTDVFSLAAVFFEMLTGKPAFPFTQGENPLLIVTRIMNGPRPELKKLRDCLPPELAGRVALIESFDVQIAKALAADPKDRHETVTEFWTAIEPALRIAAHDEPPTGPSSRVSPFEATARADRDSVLPSRIVAKLNAAPPSAATTTPIGSGPPAGSGTVSVRPSGLPGGGLPGGDSPHAVSNPPPASVVGGQLGAQLGLAPTSIRSGGAQSHKATAAMPGISGVPSHSRQSQPSLQSQSSQHSQSSQPSYSSSQVQLTAAAQRVPEAVAANPMSWKFRVVTPSIKAGTVRSAIFSPAGDIALGVGPMGIARWERGSWFSIPLPSGFDPRILQGATWLRDREILLYGEHAFVARLLPSGGLDYWNVPDRDVSFFGALAEDNGVVTLVGERPYRAAQQRSIAGTTVGVLAQWQGQRLLTLAEASSTTRLCDVTRLLTGQLVACGTFGIIVRLEMGVAETVATICTGNLTCIKRTTDGGAVTVGAGGHALVLSGRLAPTLEAVQTTRDLLSLCVSDDGAIWAGSASMRVLRRSQGSWIRIPFELGFAPNIIAIWAMGRVVRAVCDDGAVIEGAIS